MTSGRRKITSSVLALWMFRLESASPRNGIRLMNGIEACWSVSESWIRPPMTAICPLDSLITDSISRITICGIWFGTARPGVGSCTNELIRETVGFTLSSTLSASLICGVMFRTTPTGTVCGVAVNDWRLAGVHGLADLRGDVEVDDVLDHLEQSGLVVDDRDARRRQHAHVPERLEQLQAREEARGGVGEGEEIPGGRQRWARPWPCGRCRRRTRRCRCAEC